MTFEGQDPMPLLIGDHAGTWVPASTGRYLAAAMRRVMRAQRANGGVVPPDVQVAVDQFERAAARGAVLSGTGLDVVSEPESRSSGETKRWLSTGEAHVLTGLSTGYLRRLARDGMAPGARKVEGAADWSWDSGVLPASRRLSR